jgi:hypothetical protein
MWQGYERAFTDKLQSQKKSTSHLEKNFSFSFFGVNDVFEVQ